MRSGLMLGAMLVLACVSGALADVFNMPSGLTSLETVPVGNAGNASDVRYNLDRRPEGYGRVDYEYRIGKYEVTAGQYTEFLNAVAKADTYGLYDVRMWEDYGCKIERTGSPGTYQYSVSADRANRPVNCVSWGDAARFCNWLTNGQQSGGQNASTTEDGSYYLNGAISDDALMAVARKSNARYVIPTEDEWYKAAYHKNDGATGHYWDYPTSTNIVPGNVLPDHGNSANYSVACQYPSIGSPYWMTEAGAFQNSASPYGTFDQAGNVVEWTETARTDQAVPVIRGGGWNRDIGLHASDRDRLVASYTSNYWDIGFRVVEVPEPVTLSLLALGGLAMMKRRRP